MRRRHKILKNSIDRFVKVDPETVAGIGKRTVSPAGSGILIFGTCGKAGLAEFGDRFRRYRRNVIGQ